MREILRRSDFAEMIAQERAVLSFYHFWSGRSAVHGVKHFKEADVFFQDHKNMAEINFWLADVSTVDSPAYFLSEWVKNTPSVSKFYVAIGCGNPAVIWLNSGEVLNVEFSADLLKAVGIIDKTRESFNL